MSFEKSKCKFCKAEFMPKRDWQRFCEDKCRKQYWRSVYSDRQYLEKRIMELEKKFGEMRP